MNWRISVLGGIIGLMGWGLAQTAPLRLAVSLTPEELTTFEAALKKLAQTNGWNIQLENIPQAGVVEKISAYLTSNSLPDVVRLPGIFVQQWIRREAFADLTPLIARDKLSLSDFYAGPLAQFRYKNRLFGLPDSAAPDVVYYNKAMFDAAKLPYPTDRWTFEDMRKAALKLTLDAQGRSADQAGFDPKAVKQWGWNGGLTYFWQRHLVRPFEGEVCGNPDCTLMRWTDPQTLKAIEWWANLTQSGATLYDPYGGSQTGIPGDPFIAGKAAMGLNGFFAVGQLNSIGNIPYDVVQPFVGAKGRRFTPLSTNGYMVSKQSNQQALAWNLLRALLEPEFLRSTWGLPGHSVPARRSAAASILGSKQLPGNAKAIVAAMEYGQVFQPFTPSAFEAYGKTAELFKKAMTGELGVAEAAKRIEEEANKTLARDR